MFWSSLYIEGLLSIVTTEAIVFDLVHVLILDIQALKTDSVPQTHPLTIANKLLLLLAFCYILYFLRVLFLRNSGFGLLYMWDIFLYYAD